MDHAAPPHVRDFWSRWALLQEAPFTAEAAWDVLRRGPDAPADPGTLAHFLLEHPDIAFAGERFHTPRTLAACCRLLIRLQPAERERGFLIPGHRFLPLMPLSRSAEGIVVLLPDGTELPRVHVRVPAGTAALCTALFGSRDRRSLGDSREGGEISARAVLLTALGRRGPLPEALVVRCRNFEGRLYEIAPWEEADPGIREEMGRRLRRAAEALLAAPPPGPVNAPRQLLQVVAACLPEAAARPLGPLGTVLTGDPGIGVVDARAQARFIVPRAAIRNKEAGDALPILPPEVRKDAAFLLEAIEDELQDFSRAVRTRAKDCRDRIGPFTWDADERCLRVPVQGSAPRPSRPSRAGRGTCSSSPSRRGERA